MPLSSTWCNSFYAQTLLNEARAERILRMCRWNNCWLSSRAWRPEPICKNIGQVPVCVCWPTVRHSVWMEIHVLCTQGGGIIFFSLMMACPKYRMACRKYTNRQKKIRGKVKSNIRISKQLFICILCRALIFMNQLGKQGKLEDNTKPVTKTWKFYLQREILSQKQHLHTFVSK